MKILALDTSTPSASVAVADDDCILAEINSGVARTHVRQIIPMIDMALKLADRRLADMDLLAVVQGPGTFTGLRIGAAIIKGLAAAHAKPIVGVSALEALAWQAGFDKSSGGKGRHEPAVWALIDARRGDVYAAHYTWVEGHLVLQTPEIVAPPARALVSVNSPCILVGSGVLVYRDVLRDLLGQYAWFAPVQQHTIHAATVARLGRRHYGMGLLHTAATFTPLYLRKTDAELKLKPLPA